MKKLIIIILATITINSYSQSTRHLSLTTSPLVPDIGIMYNSNIILESNNPMAIYVSTEYANYDNKIGIKLFKFAIGSTFIMRDALHFSSGETQNLHLHIGLSINEDTKLNPEKYKELSIETGFTIEIIERCYFSFLIDLPNNHLKFGLGLGF